MSSAVKVDNESVRWWEKISSYITILNKVLVGVDLYCTSFVFYAYLIILYFIYFFSFDEKEVLYN